MKLTGAAQGRRLDASVIRLARGTGPPAADLSLPPRDAGAGRTSASAFAVDLDATFAFALFLIMLFSLQLNTLGAALQVVLIPAYMLVQWRRLWEILVPRAIIFVVPAYAILSVFWSEAPRETAKYGLEFGLTVLAAVLLGGASKPRSVFRGLFAAFAIYVSVALVFGHETVMGNDGAEAFSGLGDGKNLFGDIAGTGALLSLGVAVDSLLRRRLWWSAAGFSAMLVELYGMVQAHSAGAVLALVFGLFAFGCLTIVHRTGVALRAILVGFLCACLSVGAASYQWLSAQLLTLGADLFSKDPTLTGRTYLWYRAGELIHEKPILGRGFHAFWVQGNIDAEGLWRYAGITDRGGFNFHNTMVEMLVQFGWLGLALMVPVGLLSLALLFSRFVKQPTMSLCIWMGVLFYELVRMPIEAEGFGPFYYSTALIYASFAFAFRSRPRAPAPAPAVGDRPAAAPASLSRRLLTPPPARSRRLLTLCASPDK